MAVVREVDVLALQELAPGHGAGEVPHLEAVAPERGCQARVPVDVALEAEVVRLQDEHAPCRQAGGGLAEHLHELRPRSRGQGARERLGLYPGVTSPRGQEPGGPVALGHERPEPRLRPQV